MTRNPALRGLALSATWRRVSGFQASGSNATAVQGILAVLGIAVGLVVFALISAISTAWQSSTFTLAYLEWTGKDVLVE